MRPAYPSVNPSAIVTCLTCVLVLVAACGGGSDADRSSTSPSSTTAAVEPTTSQPSTTTIAEPPSTTSTSVTAEPSTVVDAGSVEGLSRPADGMIAHVQWESVVQAFDAYVGERDISAAALAVSVDGDVVVDLALGWSDTSRTEPLTTEASFRLASVTKPYTKALAVELERRGLLDLDRQVLCTPEANEQCIIDLTAESTAVGRTVNEQMAAITLRHLLDHTAGFDRDRSFDPMFAPLFVREELGLDRLPLERDIATWVLAEPLDFEPGSSYVYSNVGYLLAGLAIEEQMGAPFLELLGDYLGVGDELALGSSLPTEREPLEVEYACDEGLAINLFDEFGPGTCWADGGFHLEAMTAHGRLVAPAAEVLAFLDNRCIDGYENGGFCDAWHDGSLSGTYTVARNLGRVNYVVLFNQRADPAHPGFGYTDVVDEADGWVRGIVGDAFA